MDRLEYEDLDVRLAQLLGLPTGNNIVRVCSVYITSCPTRTPLQGGIEILFSKMCSNLELKKMYLCKYSYFKDNIPDIINEFYQINTVGVGLKILNALL